MTPIFRGWWVVAACFVLALAAWSVAFYGFSVYHAELMRLHGWSAGTISGAVTLHFLLGAVAMVPAGAAIDRYGPRRLIAPGIVAMAAGLALLSLAARPGAQPWQVYLAYAVMALGWAVMSGPAIAATISPWFDRRQGLASTFALTGATVGGMVGPAALLAGTERVGLATVLQAAAVLLVLVVLPVIVLLVRRRPQDFGLRPDGAAIEPQAGRRPPPPARRWTRGEALRTRAFLTVSSGFALAMVVQVAFLTQQVPILLPVLGREGAALAVSLTAIAGIAGRFAVAPLADRGDARILAAIVFATQAVAVAIVAVASTPALIWFAAILFGIGVGNAITLPPLIVRREFGTASFGTVFGLSSAVVQVSFACGPMLVGIARDAAGGYGPVLLAVAGLDVAAAVILLAGRARDRSPGASGPTTAT